MNMATQIQTTHVEGRNIATRRETLVAKYVKVATVQAVADMRVGNCSAAIASLCGVIEATGDWACQFWLAVAYMTAGQWVQARRQFLHVSESCPNAELRRIAFSMLIVIERTTER